MHVCDKTVLFGTNISIMHASHQQGNHPSNQVRITSEMDRSLSSCSDPRIHLKRLNSTLQNSGGPHDPKPSIRHRRTRSLLLVFPNNQSGRGKYSKMIVFIAFKFCLKNYLSHFPIQLYLFFFTFHFICTIYFFILP
jgi:hypothetical protein